MDLQLKGLKAVVTGGTRGIGRAIVEGLAAEGCDVALCARDASAVEETVTALRARGVKSWGAAVDVAATASLRGFVADAAQAFGGLDIFVANVSALTMGMDEASWRHAFEIDVLGTIAGIEAALPHLEKSGKGSVVVIGTVAASEVVGPTRPYSSVKAALVPYVKSLAINLARKKVRVNLVSPGTIYFKGGVWHQREVNAPELYKAALARNPTGRMGTPAEVADAVVFLASPRSSFTSGANLIVDGAVTQRVQF
ncbi:MAG TPA: SDR family oxidoreductase [Stellaceae bacterium]|nr:SDR family oxidoreductase [Stellaceae bacterium]